MKRVRLISTIVVAATLLTLAWWRHRGAGHETGVRTDLAPLQVGVQSAAIGSINVYLDGLGTVTPLATATVRAQVSGQLIEVAFKEGQMVKKGAVLAVVDPRPFQAALEQTQGQLRQARAQLAEARIDLSRYEKLSRQDSIAQQQVDAQHALVSQYEGLVETDQAAVDNATLNLAYCHIVSPFTGRVGLRMVDEGNYVTPGDANGLVVLTREKPITVIFTLSEQSMPEVAARLRAGTEIPVEAFDQTQTHKLASGILSAIDNEVDTTTGTFRLRAVFPNGDESLFPNQFVNVRMLLNIDHSAIVIPTSGIERNQEGSFVYVVKPDNTVTARPVTFGPTEGSRVAVRSGLTLGDRVVIDGADEIKEGMPVTAQSVQ